MTIPWPLRPSASYLQQLVTAISSSWSVEHTAEGRHNWKWKAPAFDAARFQGDGTITWTVTGEQRILEEYGVLGDVMLWTVVVANSSTGGTASTALRVTLPDTYRLASRLSVGAGYTDDNGTQQAAYVWGITGNRYVELYQSDGGNWNNASTNTDISFSVWLRVTR